MEPPPPDCAPGSAPVAGAGFSPIPMVPSGPYFLGLPLFFFTSSPPLAPATAPPPEPGCCCGCGCMPGAPESGRYMAPGGTSAGFMGDEAPGDAMGLKASGIPCITFAVPGGIPGWAAAPNAAACCIMTPPAAPPPGCGGDPTGGGGCG